MDILPNSFLLLVPVFPLLAAILSMRHPGSSEPGFWATRAAFGSLGVSLLGVVMLIFSGPDQWRWSPLGGDSPVAMTLRMDAISITMAVLVSFLGLAVIRFSRNYLAGDAHQGRFFGWLCATLASVLLLVLSGNLLVLWLAWVATSLCLHRLLVFYPDRSAALFAARKKFVFSRLGDLCLLAAIGWIYAEYGTLEMDRLFAMADGGTGGISVTAWLLVACAILKSAQFPFHGWLPDTMETPTPVSALMHAGIINAGGFLLIRLSPLLVDSGLAMHFVAVLGAITAAFGAVVMLAQPSVKRALAYSTIAQMGFMLVQCGLGAFGLALLHIVAHSLYKAHAFLRSGSTLMAPPRAAVPLRWPHLAFGLGFGTMATLVATVLARPWLGHEVPAVLVLVTALAVAYGLARVRSIDPGAGRLVLAVCGALIVPGLVLALHGLVMMLYPGLPKFSPPLGVTIFVGTVFVGLFLLQSFVWRAGQTAFGRRFYIHALNGFYIGTLGNRLLNLLWPPHVTSLSQRPKPRTAALVQAPAQDQTI